MSIVADIRITGRPGTICITSQSKHQQQIGVNVSFVDSIDNDIRNNFEHHLPTLLTSLNSAVLKIQQLPKTSDS